MNKSSDFVFLQYKTGHAYYYTLKSIYECYRVDNSEFTIRHLLTGNVYTVTADKLNVVKWMDIPQSYRTDAFALNKEIRDLGGNKTNRGVYKYGNEFHIPCSIRITKPFKIIHK